MTRNRWRGAAWRSLRWCVALPLLLTGCPWVVTLEPVVAPSDARFDARLIGDWAETDGGRARVTSVAGERDYTIKYITDRDTLALRARLGRIGNRDVLDVWPTTDGMQGPYGALFTPTHLVFVADIGNDEVRLAPLLGDSVVAVMARAHNDLMHTRHSDDVVLHGSTRQLRSSLASAIAAPSSRDSVILWRRSASRDK